MLSFRDMRDEGDEYRLLLRWLQNPLVLERYGTEDFPSGAILDKVKRKYGVPFRPTKGYGPAFWRVTGRLVPPQDTPNSVLPDKWGIDLFIGEDSFQDRGNGTQFLHWLFSFCFGRKSAKHPTGSERGKSSLHPLLRKGRLSPPADDGRWIMARGRR